MKILVISDSHSPSRAVVDFDEFIQDKNFDLLIHCWDYDVLKTYLHLKSLVKDKFLWVYWNSDSWELRDYLKEFETTEISWNKILVFHSHQIRRWDEQGLLHYAKKFWVNVVFYWHTHKQKITKYKEWMFENLNKITKIEKDCIYFINPWTLKNGEYLELNI